MSDYCPGKYALSNLASYLPAECHVTTDDADDSSRSSNETLCAIISTLTDLVTDSTRTTKYATASHILLLLFYAAFPLGCTAFRLSVYLSRACPQLENQRL